jgi:hypothetical protein
MIVGYDTYHDARNRKAVGAFVASINTSYTRYNSSVKIHPANEDISPSFKDHMLKSLKYNLHLHFRQWTDFILKLNNQGLSNSKWLLSGKNYRLP